MKHYRLRQAIHHLPLIPIQHKHHNPAPRANQAATKDLRDKVEARTGGRVVMVRALKEKNHSAVLISQIVVNAHLEIPKNKNLEKIHF